MNKYLITCYDELFKKEMTGVFITSSEDDAILEACEFWEISENEIISVERLNKTI